MIALTDPPPPELVKRGHGSPPFYSDMRVMVPLIIATVALLGAGAAAVLCWRRSKYHMQLSAQNGGVEHKAC
jgi:hypothetical protein